MVFPSSLESLSLGWSFNQSLEGLGLGAFLQLGGFFFLLRKVMYVLLNLRLPLKNGNMFVNVYYWMDFQVSPSLPINGAVSSMLVFCC